MVVGSRVKGLIGGKSTALTSTATDVTVDHDRHAVWTKVTNTVSSTATQAAVVIPMNQDETAMVWAEAIARKSTDTESSGYLVLALFKRVGSAAVARISTESNQFVREDDSGYMLNWQTGTATGATEGLSFTVNDIVLETIQTSTTATTWQIDWSINRNAA